MSRSTKNLKYIFSLVKQSLLYVWLRAKFKGDKAILHLFVQLQCVLHERNSILRFINEAIQRGCTFDIQERRVTYEKNGITLTADIFDTSFLTVLDEVSDDEYELDALDLNGKIVLDIGANLGFVSLKCFGKGAKEVILVEPNFKLNPYIHANLTQNGFTNYKIVNEGIGQSEEIVEISYRPWASAGTNLISPRVDKELNNWPRIKLPITTFSLFATKHIGEKTIDLIKMDCEGGEYAIVVDQMFENYSPNHVLVEYHSGPNDVVSALKRLGYNMKIKPKSEDVGLILATKKQHKSAERQ